MYKADRLYNEMVEIEGKIAALKVTDSDSLTEYFRLYTHLVWDYKEIGNLYDIYADDAVVYRENGGRLFGAHEVVRDATVFLCSFPDLQITFEDTFAVDKGDCYKLWRFYHLNGTSIGPSQYGPPTGKALGGQKCLVMNMATVEMLDGRPQITKEYTMYSAEWIRDVCTAGAAPAPEETEDK